MFLLEKFDAEGATQILEHVRLILLYEQSAETKTHGAIIQTWVTFDRFRYL